MRRSVRRMGVLMLMALVITALWPAAFLTTGGESAETGTAAAASGAAQDSGAKSLQAESTTAEVRGLWVPFCDFETYGLKDVSAGEFRANFRKILTKAQEYGVNTIIFHARAFDDATWRSKTFKASAYLTSKASAGKTANETYSYDPLKIVIEECHKKNMRIEAWLNPYRITKTLFLNPKSKYSTKRINRAVNELQKYPLDGIHFDDYFYHSQGQYITPKKSSRYKISVKGKKTSKTPSAANMRKYVNKMVRKVYKNVHEKAGWTFGISPQGNVDNCLGSGADLTTWLSKPGYIDYIAPQLYWSDQYGKKANVTMFSDRLNQFVALNKNNTPMYIGLALYKAGTKISTDPGWKKTSKNLSKQVKLLRAAGAKGFFLYTAKDLVRGSASKELNNLKKVL